MVTFGERLRALREERGWTQRELAERSGVPFPTVCNHEQGRRNPSWPQAVKLAKALGVSLDVFGECDIVERGDAEDQRAAERAKARRRGRPRKEPPAEAPAPRRRKGTK